MLYEEFTNLTKMYVDTWTHEEIDKVYSASELSKQDWCKNYKANKDGMQEGIAIRVSERQWRTELELSDKDLLIKELRKNCDELQHKVSEANDAAIESVNNWIRSYNTEADRANKAEARVEELEAEVMRLKAKLYDLMVKENGAA